MQEKLLRWVVGLMLAGFLGASALAGCRTQPPPTPDEPQAESADDAENTEDGDDAEDAEAPKR